jgi:hypothetical protein
MYICVNTKNMYRKEISLKDYETLAKIDNRTGEFIELKSIRNNIPEGKKVFQSTNFTKLNINVILILQKELSTEELGIVMIMCSMADYNSNSLCPLSNKTSVRDLAEHFNIGINRVSIIFRKLFNLGVYAELKIANSGINEYWILNPYISFKGKLINEIIDYHFSTTEISKKLFNSQPSIKD